MIGGTKFDLFDNVLKETQSWRASWRGTIREKQKQERKHFEIHEWKSKHDDIIDEMLLCVCEERQR